MMLDALLDGGVVTELFALLVIVMDAVGLSGCKPFPVGLDTEEVLPLPGKVGLAPAGLVGHLA